MDESIKIDVINPTADSEIVLRRGDAEKISYPVPIKISGFIDAPFRYIEKRKHLINKDLCLVLVNRKEESIMFEENPRDEYAAKIQGRLKINPDLLEFGINNTVKPLELNAMIKFLRMKRLFFADKDVFKTFFEKLTDFKGNVTTELQRTQDTRGNFKAVIDKKAETSLPTDFILEMPIYEGQPEIKFKVDLCYDVREMAIEFWLESIELFELLKSELDLIFDNLLATVDTEYVVIEQ